MLETAPKSLDDNSNSGTGTSMEKSWARVSRKTVADAPTPLALERHYTVAEVAEMWGWSEEKVHDVFRDEPGVLQSRLRTLLSRKRQNITRTIPATVLIRVHDRLGVK